MGELLRKNEQLPMRNFQILGLRCRCRIITLSRFWSWSYELNSDGNTFLQFNLSDRDCSICAIEHALNKASLSIPGTICELWHRREKLIGNRRSQTGICFAYIERLKGSVVERIFGALTDHACRAFDLITVITKKFACDVV
jgi:hypothetical protein